MDRSASEDPKRPESGANILDASSPGDSKKEETTNVADSIEKADGFAQVFPEHKFHIVEVLQKRSHLVGMTGPENLIVCLKPVTEVSRSNVNSRRS
ncbi:hypothetical protein [Marinobacter subterrani]|uniref:hypothetical protein n=1 Tax=Marinobacter subterrani TaxID=1658765 RepID=UPI002352545F|nr:hypothetical protein [Marinobacter subterrani]